MPERFEIQRNEADQRLDKLLRQHFPNLTFGQAQKLIRGGRVRVDGRRAKAADRIPAGAVLTLPYQGTIKGETPCAPALDKYKLYEDETLLALNKPAGLAVQGGSGVQTHVAGLIADTNLRLVHRLDRDTSGALLLGKGALAAKQLTRCFANQGVEKRYLAVVMHADQGSGTLNLWLRKTLCGGEGRMAIAPAQAQGAQEAITRFEVLSRSPAAVLLSLSPQTGRTHQLRAHCAHAFGGIFGDGKYGSAGSRAKGLLLHAWHLRFMHPHTETLLEIEAPISAMFSEHLADLGLEIPQTWTPL